MAENSVVINPDSPTPPPAPNPTPNLATVTPESLKKDFDSALAVVRVVTEWLPAGPKGVLEKLVNFAVIARGQDWVFDVLVSLLNRFGDKQPTPEEFKQAFFSSMVAQGKKIEAVTAA